MSLFFLRAFIFLVMTAFAIAEPASSNAKEDSHFDKESAPIDLPAPIGEDMKGIMIPQYDAEGHLVMNFIAEKVRKINSQEVEIDSLKIGFFERDGKDVSVFAPHGKFHLETKILTTDSEVTIKREDFDMVGESATFDTTRRYGTMKGHVHTEIRNVIPAQVP